MMTESSRLTTQVAARVEQTLRRLVLPPGLIDPRRTFLRHVDLRTLAPKWTLHPSVLPFVFHIQYMGLIIVAPAYIFDSRFSLQFSSAELSSNALPLGRQEGSFITYGSHLLGAIDFGLKMPTTMARSLLFILVEEEQTPWPAVVKPFAMEYECNGYREQTLLCIVTSDHVRTPMVMERADWKLYGVPGNAIVTALKGAIADTRTC